MAQSKFAMRMLEKQGWKEGDGLGKKRDGISKPIKAFMKQDKAGLGQDLGADLTDHWWLKVFNDAAKTNVTKTEEEVKETKAPQNRLYSAFVKKSTLKQGKEEKDSDSSSEEDDREESGSSSNLPTLDDIHKYCGGATGHRAATLGIKMTGKLKRAAEHERLFAERMKGKTEASSKDDESNELSGTNDVSRKKKKKKKKDAERDTSKESRDEKSIDGNLNECKDHSNTNSEAMVCENGEVENVKRKKKNKKSKKRLEDEDELFHNSEGLEDVTEVKKRKKSKRQKTDLSDSLDVNTESVEVAKNEQKKKKKKRH